MTVYMRALSALYRGFQLCFSQPEIRRLAAKPWKIGAISYVIAILIAIFSVSPLHRFMTGILESYVGDLSGGFVGWLAAVFVFICVIGFLLIATIVGSFAAVMIFSGVFQGRISETVLGREGIAIREGDGTVRGAAKDVYTSASSEIIKLLILLPLGFVTVLFGIIPFIAPFAFIFGSWLLAYQFVDVPLEARGLPVGERIRFAFQRFPIVALYGVTLAVVWPFLGIILPPIAVAGASWLLADEELQREISQLAR